MVFTHRTAQQAVPHIYIALGDSVSSGYGLPGYPASPEGGHSTKFFEKLKQRGFVDEYHNMAVSGFTTTKLLEKLNNLSSAELKLFRNARIITLNIGGNNILLPFLSYLSDLQVVSSAGTLITSFEEVFSEAWSVIHETLWRPESIIPGVSEAGFSLGAVVTGIGDLISGIGGLITGASEIIAGYSDIVSLWLGSLSPELQAILEEGTQAFAADFREIITWLETNAPNATLIVNTIHNPIPQKILIASVPISGWANTLLQSMNYIILQESESRGFLAVDFNSYFLNRLYLTHFNINPFSATLSFDLVHPNAKGHSLIADLHYAYFMNNLQSCGGLSIE